MRHRTTLSPGFAPLLLAILFVTRPLLTRGNSGSKESSGMHRVGIRTHDPIVRAVIVIGYGLN